MKFEKTAKRLQIALKELGISQQELAEKSGVSKSSISQYINGTHEPSNISSTRMAEVLNVNPMWLMGFEVAQHQEMNTADYTVKAPTYNGYIELIIESTQNMDKEMVARLFAYIRKLNGKNIPQELKDAMDDYVLGDSE